MRQQRASRANSNKPRYAELEQPKTALPRAGPRGSIFSVAKPRQVNPSPGLLLPWPCNAECLSAYDSDGLLFCVQRPRDGFHRHGMADQACHTEVQN